MDDDAYGNGGQSLSVFCSQPLCFGYEVVSVVAVLFIIGR